MQSTIFAANGIDLTHPFWDRDLVEFVLLIHPLDLPFEGQSKTLVRQAFAHDLPSSVLQRRTRTFADDYLREVPVRQYDAYRKRYRTLPEGVTFIDANAYATALELSRGNSLTTKDLLALQRSWHATSFVEGLPRYGATTC